MLLRTKVLDRQRELDLRDGEMADRLGIPRTSYNSMKTGQYKVSLYMARRIVAAFPDLAPYALMVDDDAPRERTRAS